MSFFCTKNCGSTSVEGVFKNFYCCTECNKRYVKCGSLRCTHPEKYHEFSDKSSNKMYLIFCRFCDKYYCNDCCPSNKPQSTTSFFIEGCLECQEISKRECKENDTLLRGIESKRESEDLLNTATIDIKSSGKSISAVKKYQAKKEVRELKIDDNHPSHKMRLRKKKNHVDVDIEND